MLIYTKRSFDVCPRRFALDLARKAELGGRSIEEARALLIEMGQLEQAVLDAGCTGGGMLAKASRIAAGIFLDARRDSPAASGGRAAVLAQRLRQAAARLDDRHVPVRVPEGFAWYALYPDSYAETADAWADHYAASCRRVGVVGIRSIGTALAAVVAEALSRRGLDISVTTVRTSGHPFARKAELPADLRPGDRSIVVDEGPGLSGSSMAAVGEALVRRGAPSSGIDFFAGHAHGPGPQGDAAVSRWWSPDRVWAAGLGQTRIGALPLHEELAAAAESWLDEPSRGPAVVFGADDWRTRSGLRSLPRACAPPLETPKLLVEGRSGRAVLLKFAGLAATSAGAASPVAMMHARLQRLAEAGCTPQPCGMAHGWIAVPWLEGRRLTVADGTARLVQEHLAPYIALASADVLAPQEVADGSSRIADAVSAWAEVKGLPRVSDLIEVARARYLSRFDGGAVRAYGDGRLAPHEWLCAPAGTILKLDAGGHDRDHTWVGRQPVAWDVAGCAVEWDLDAERTALLRDAVGARLGTRIDAATLAFHLAGYCAFRAALAHHCAVLAPGAEHAAAAARWYDARLTVVLAQIEASHASDRP